MLVNTVFKEGDVISLKMVNGDEYICKFVSEDLISISVKRPLALVPTPQGVAMTDAMMSIDNDNMTAPTVRISKSAVMIQSKTRKEIADGYTSTTSTIKKAISLPG